MALFVCPRPVIDHPLDEKIGEALLRALELQYGRPPESSPEEEEGEPAHRRYAIMARLLDSAEDERHLLRTCIGPSGLHAWRTGRREAFLGYLNRLKLECSELYDMKVAEMESDGYMDALYLFTYRVFTRTAILQLRYYALCYKFGITVNTEPVRELISWLLSGPVPRQEASQL